MSQATRVAMIETLEGRQLFSAAAAGALLALPATTKTSLTAAQVEGTYTGTETDNKTKITQSITITTSATLVSLAIDGDTLTGKVTPAKLRSFEAGKIAMTLSHKKTSVTITGTFTSGGLLIAGSDKTTHAGTHKTTHSTGRFSVSRVVLA